MGQLDENFFFWLLDVLDCHINDKMYVDTFAIFVVIFKGGYLAHDLGNGSRDAPIDFISPFLRIRASNSGCKPKSIMNG